MAMREITLALEPLTHAAFAPYGAIVGGEGRAADFEAEHLWNWRVPFEADGPTQLSFIMSDSTARVLVTDGEHAAIGAGLAGPDFEILNMDELPADGEASNLGLRGSPDDLASLLYTSGSTGQPKVRVGSWVCENVGQAGEMPFWLNCRNFDVNEINGLEGAKLRASSRFTQKTGKIGVSTQSGS